MAKEPKEMPKRIEIVFQDALDNMMFFKRQQWIVGAYAMAAYAALFTVAKTVQAGTPGRIMLSIAVALVAGYAHFVLSGYEDAFGKIRDRLQRIYGEYFSEVEREMISADQRKKDNYFLKGLKVLSGGAALTAIVAVWGLPAA